MLTIHLGRLIQTLWQDGFKVILSSPTLWRWVWVDWPKLCGGMGSGSYSVCPHYGKGFGQTDPNLVAGWVHDHTQFIHTVGMGLGRLIQILWQDGFRAILTTSPLLEWVWADRLKPCGRMGSGSSLVCPHWGERIKVDRPKPCGRMGSRSSLIRPLCGKGFGLTDPHNPQNLSFNAAGIA